MSGRTENVTRINTRRLIRRVFLFWVIVEIALVVGDGFINDGHGLDAFFDSEKSARSLRRLFNMAREDSLGTWFASVQALLCAQALALVRLKAKGAALTWDNARAWRPAHALLGSLVDGLRPFLDLFVRFYARFWTRILAISIGFYVYLGTDDALGLHEKLGSAFERMADGTRQGGGGWAARILDWFPSYPWQVLFVPILLVFFALVLGYALVEYMERRDLKALALVWGGFGFLGVAVVLDYGEGMKGGWEGMIAPILDASNASVRHWAKVIEEVVEMFGFTCFLTGFLHHWAGSSRTVEIRHC